MLTSDIALLKDSNYLSLSQRYKTSLPALDVAFSHAWYKLTTRDMGPITRCLGNLVPPVQPFQYELPPSPPAASLPDFAKVRAAVKVVMRPASVAPGALAADQLPDGSWYYGASFVQLAWHCATTFRQTDYLGGCNGARIRFPPQKDWLANAALDEVLKVLLSVQTKFVSLSWADLIVFAAQVALEDASGVAMTFCGGRTDAAGDDGASDYLSPVLMYNATDYEVRERLALIGLSVREHVALSARLRGAVLQKKAGYSGTWAENPGNLSNGYFKTLLSEAWEKKPLANGGIEYRAVVPGSRTLYMTPVDLNIRFSDDFLAVAQEFAVDEQLFLADFASAWTRVMNMDRFDGPLGNVCVVAPNEPSTSTSTFWQPEVVAAISVVATFVVTVIAIAAFLHFRGRTGTEAAKPFISV